MVNRLIVEKAVHMIHDPIMHAFWERMTKEYSEQENWKDLEPIRQRFLFEPAFHAFDAFLKDPSTTREQLLRMGSTIAEILEPEPKEDCHKPIENQIRVEIWFVMLFLSVEDQTSRFHLLTLLGKGTYKIIDCLTRSSFLQQHTEEMRETGFTKGYREKYGKTHPSIREYKPFSA